jgi:hypothetical protein
VPESVGVPLAASAVGVVPASVAGAVVVLLLQPEAANVRRVNARREHLDVVSMGSDLQLGLRDESALRAARPR